MSKSNLSWLAVALALAGVSIMTGHPAWGVITGAAMAMLAGGLAIGLYRPESERRVEDPNASQKVSNSLVTLSAAAIIAVYAAGFSRTRPAAEEIEARSARRRAVPVSAVTLTASEGVSAPAATVSSAPAGVPRKTSKKSSAPRTAANASNGAPAGTAALATPLTLGGMSLDDIAPNRPISPAGQYKDGTYLGWGRSRHGDIQASVVIRDGHIISTAIATCATRYNCSWIEMLPGQAVVRQSADVDFVSGATQSSNAFSDAVTEALTQARE